jgi:rod shape-determining protein MreD
MKTRRIARNDRGFEQGTYRLPWARLVARPRFDEDLMLLGRLDRMWRLSLPVGSVILAVLLTVIPIGFGQLSSIMPAFGLMAIYYWTVSRPESMPALFVFVFGILQDSLSGAPIGLWAVVFLSAHYFVISQRRLLAGQAFSLAWFGFALLTVLAGILAWGLACAVFMQIVPPVPGAVQAFLTIMLYPPVAWGLAQLHRLMPKGLK